MKLEFGNPKHIALRDIGEIEAVWARLKDKIKCPFCKAKATCYYDYNLDEKRISINFDCDSDCNNSIDAGNFDLAETDFDFNGKLLN
jgi:hypothetical protein